MIPHHIQILKPHHFASLRSINRNQIRICSINCNINKI